jgi:hypothetical protein
MRKFIAIVALLCGATGAYAAEPQKWCDEDGKQIVQPSEDTFILDGRALVSDEWELTDIDRADGQSEAALILIKTNRVFWPCKD